MERDSKWIVRDYTHWTLYLHTNQCYLGRMFLWAKREDAVDLADISDSEKNELHEILRSLRRALAGLFKPDLMNYGSLGNVTKHLHVHVVPRYASPRMFDGRQFLDERWGHNYYPYNREHVTPERTLVKIKEAIAEKV